MAEEYSGKDRANGFKAIFSTTSGESVRIKRCSFQLTYCKGGSHVGRNNPFAVTAAAIIFIVGKVRIIGLL